MEKLKTKKFILGDMAKIKSSIDKNEHSAISIKSKDNANLSQGITGTSQGNNSYVEGHSQNKSMYILSDIYND